MYRFAIFSLALLAACTVDQSNTKVANPNAISASPIDVERAITPATKVELEKLMVNLDEEVTAYADSFRQFPEGWAFLASVGSLHIVGSDMVAGDLRQAYPNRSDDELYGTASDYVVAMMDARFAALKANAQPEGATK